MSYDVIIIGGGLAGLSAGAFLSRNGRKVLLLEQHYIPGGCATTFKRRDYVMEAGLHAMDGHLVNPDNGRSLFKHLGIRNKVEFIQVPDFFHLKKGSSLEFTFPKGEAEAVRALIAAYPGEEKGIRKFMDTLMGVQHEISALPRKFWGKLLKYPLFPFFFPLLFRNFRKNLGQFLETHIRDENLKLVLQGNLLYYHDDPFSLSLVFFAKAQASFIKYGGYFIRGGSQQLSNALADVIREHGGKVLLGKQVEEILMEGGKACGVHYRDSFNESLTPERALGKEVIHSGALPLVKGLLPESQARKIASGTDKLQAATSLLTVYMGIKGDLASLGSEHYSTVYMPEKLNDLQQVSANFHGPWEERAFVFVDYGRIHANLCPEGYSIGAICTADSLDNYKGLSEEAYQEKKEEIAQILIQRLEKELPGIKDLIDCYEVGTARTIRRYTLNPAGAPYGYAQTPGQIAWNRPSYKSAVKGLWLAGTWTFPGGGFTGALLSGFLCAWKVNRALGPEKEARADQEASLDDPRQVKLVNKASIAMGSLELSFEKPTGFAHRPGQYAVLSLDSAGPLEHDMPLRTMSICSHPDEPLLRFAMRSGHSPFKRSCMAMEEGQTVTIFGPSGGFCLSGNQRGKVFLSSGIGISPILPMLKELEKQAFPGEVLLLSSNRHKEQAAYHRELQALELPRFRYLPVWTSTEARLDARRLKKEIADPAAMEYYLVGASSFLKSMVHALHELGLNPKHIMQDDFG